MIAAGDKGVEPAEGLGVPLAGGEPLAPGEPLASVGADGEGLSVLAVPNR